MAADCNNHIIHPSTNTGNTHLPPLTISFLEKTLFCSLMDLVLFALCLMVMGALTLQLVLLTELHIRARKGELSEEGLVNIEKLRDRKEFMKIVLLFIVALALTIIELYLIGSTPPCTNPTVCNYLMSIM